LDRPPPPTPLALSISYIVAWSSVSLARRRSSSFLVCIFLRSCYFRGYDLFAGFKTLFVFGSHRPFGTTAQKLFFPPSNSLPIPKNFLLHLSQEEKPLFSFLSAFYWKSFNPGDSPQDSREAKRAPPFPIRLTAVRQHESPSVLLFSTPCVIYVVPFVIDSFGAFPVSCFFLHCQLNTLSPFSQVGCPSCWTILLLVVLFRSLRGRRSLGPLFFFTLYFFFFQ